jgi:hypothetical protein
MRFIIAFLVALSSCVLAAPMDTLTMERAVTDATLALQRLDATIQLYTHNSKKDTTGQQKQHDSDSSALTDTFHKGAAKVRSGPTASAKGTKELDSKLNAFISQVEKTIGGTYVNARSVIVAAGGQKPVSDALKNQERAAVDFGKAVVSKLPSGDSVGKRLEKSITSEYDKAIRKIA